MTAIRTMLTYLFPSVTGCAILVTRSAAAGPSPLNRPNGSEAAAGRTISEQRGKADER